MVTTTVDRHEGEARIDSEDSTNLNLHRLTPILRSAPQYSSLLASLESSGSRSRAQVLSDSVPFLVSALLEDLDLPAVTSCPD